MKSAFWLAFTFNLFLSLISAASLPDLSQLSISNDTPHDNTSPFNISISANGTQITSANPSQNIPPDPFSYLVPYPGSSGTTVKFYGYGTKRLNPIDVAWTLNEALCERRKHAVNGKELLGTKELEFAFHGVVLLLYPESGMDWWQFGVMLKGLLHFASTYDNVELFFDVYSSDGKVLGTGALSNFS
ncbi:hypothetical protein ACLMJK_005779 [Lecanora helva]